MPIQPRIVAKCRRPKKSPTTRIWISYAQAAAKVTIAITRIGQGHTPNVKGAGGGVVEYKIDFCRGYRVYFGKDGDRLVILLGGGTKKRQKGDIEAALDHWQDYKRRK